MNTLPIIVCILYKNNNNVLNREHIQMVTELLKKLRNIPQNAIGKDFFNICLFAFLSK